MQKNYAEHHAEVVVNAPVHQVYTLFSHFNDFPKFMSFVKEVTYQDDQHSHWVAEMLGRHEWNAENEGWLEDRQIGWHSTNGLENFGKVTFEPTSANQTKVDVFIDYNPPSGILGEVGEKLGAGSRFEHALQKDLNQFAEMVAQAPVGALDPTSSNYLFHEESAASKGKTTEQQNQTMYTNPNLNRTESTTPTLDRDIVGSSGTHDIDTGAAPVEPTEIDQPRRNPDNTESANPYRTTDNI
ncbi:MAG TPA: SRPBCC family protein [Dictyobacter sp.]|jgi:uncharacterized membrane protein|nr:SRPBCC family protein [Dictyobacter sp.]